MIKKSDKSEQDSLLAQYNIVAVAAYLSGASRKPTETEDIAVKANEIAPGRFTWRKYKDQIDLELVYKHLWDLTKLEKVTGSKKDGWMLTPSGTSFAEKAAKTIKGLDLGKNRLLKKDKERLARDRARMLVDPAYLKVSSGRATELTRSEAERFFRLDDYVIGEARERKLTLAESAFHDDKQLSETIAAAAKLVRDKK